MPTIGIVLSLSVIIGVLVITTVASLIKVRRDPSAAQRPGVDSAADAEVRPGG